MVRKHLEMRRREKVKMLLEVLNCCFIH